MPISKKNFAPFVPGQYYHVFNHANGGDDLFVDMDDYSQFLLYLQQNALPWLRILAWCLLKNHFHLIIQVRKESEVPDSRNINAAVGEAFRLAFSLYAQEFNQRHDRGGSLFKKRFRHVWIDQPEYLYQAVHYVNRNAAHHGLAASIADWRWSSFHAVRDATPDGLTDIPACLALFEGSRNQFLRLHGMAGEYPKELGLAASEARVSRLVKG
jgi:REP element-mobilizing transposase RayT